jgi:hypothetical protein
MSTAENEPVAAQSPGDPGAPADAAPTGDPVSFIESQLLRARRIWRTSETLTRSFTWCGCVFGGLLLLFLLDNLLDLPGWLRLILGLSAVLGTLGSLALWVLAPLFWKIKDEAAAVYLERKTGERQNLLINAVQFHKNLAGGNGASGNGQPAVGGSPAMMAHVVSQAADHAVTLNLRALWEKKRLRNLGLTAVCAFLLLTLYAALMPAYAQNALARFAKPLSGTPPVAHTRVLMFPTDEVELLSGDNLAVHGLAFVDKGVVPSEAMMVAEMDGTVRRIPMGPAPSPHAELLKAAPQNLDTVAFFYECPNISKSFIFHVVAGDGRSYPCKVRVRERPGVEDVHLELKPPEYTGQGASSQPSPSGVVHALTGTQATVVFKATRELASGAVTLPDGSQPIQPRAQGRWEAAFKVAKEGTYTISLKAKDGVEAKNAFEGRILPQADGLPAVAFETQTLNISVAPGSTVPLAIRAQDDFGLKTVSLICKRQEGNEGAEKDSDFTTVKAWNFPVPGPRDTKELYPVTLDPAKFLVGGTYVFFAEATDHCPRVPRKARSAPLLLRVMTPEQMALRPDSPFEPVFHRIQKLIDLQTKARGKTVTVREFLDEVLSKNLLDKRVVSIRESQMEVNSATDTLAKELNTARDATVKSKSSDIGKTLAELLAGPMPQVLKLADETKTFQKDQAKARGTLQTIETVQTSILNRLMSLLGHVATVDKEKKEEAASLEDNQDNQRLRDQLEETKDKVGEFIKEQKKVIQSTEELEKKAPEDLTEEDKKKLGELAKEEQDWAKYFKEKFTDLSKVPDQDFSNSKLAKEFNEVYQEIQKAAEALQGKNMEIAVRNEEAGLELAEKIETNLEKWLTDTRDTQKWSMEEPQGQFDVPLADIPEELEDIVGELIDEEEKMTEDVQDVSSSWMDSLDKGAGWDAADGNISNMSAKGVTGNRQPNDMEISGRSGEGRSGKSQGQFVEETADGKGGKQTPSRNTQDPYEEGQVDDKSKDPIGGATGGGKTAGVSAQGLRGTPPPATAAKMERLKDMQASLRQEAERVQTKLNAYHLPSSDMAEAVAKMKSIETHLAKGTGFNLRQAHSSVIDSLKETKTVLHYQAKINTERSRDLPKNVRHGILSGMQQKAPVGYQDLMEAYFKSLVEEKE